jgi:hypothetical protein
MTRRIVRHTLLSLALTPQSVLSYFPPSLSLHTVSRRCITIHTRISPRKLAVRKSSNTDKGDGSTSSSTTGIRSSSRTHEVGERPPCPKSLESRLEDSVDRVSTCIAFSIHLVKARFIYILAGVLKLS